MSFLKKYSDSNFREIRPEDPDKKGIKLFWELFTRKFWSYIKLNLLYAFTSILSLVVYWCILAMYVVPGILSAISSETIEMMAAKADSTVEMFAGSIIFYFSGIGALLLVTFFCGGICSAGYNYILINYVRQENAYVFSDFFNQTRKNAGQAFALSIIDILVVSTGLFSLSYYFGLMLNGGGALCVFAFGLLVFALLMYIAMHTYLWTIMVTFKVSLKQLFKNSLMLTIGTAVRTVIYMLCVVAFTVLTLGLFAYSPIVVAMMFFVVLMVLFNLAGHIFSYPVIKKYMIDNNNQNTEGIDE